MSSMEPSTSLLLSTSTGISTDWNSLVSKLKENFFQYLREWEEGHPHDSYKSRHDAIRESLAKFTLTEQYQVWKGSTAGKEEKSKLSEAADPSSVFVHVLLCAKAIESKVTSSSAIAEFNKRSWLPFLSFGLLQHDQGTLGGCYSFVEGKFQEFSKTAHSLAILLPDLDYLVREIKGLDLPRFSEKTLAEDFLSRLQGMFEPSVQAKNLSSIAEASLSEEEYPAGREKILAPKSTGTEELSSELVSPASKTPKTKAPKARRTVAELVVVFGGKEVSMTQKQYRRLGGRKGGTKPPLVTNDSADVDSDTSPSSD